MELWSEYIEEKYGTKIGVHENAFYTYKVCPGGEFYVDDIYIRKEYRSGSQFTVLYNEIGKLALANGCDRISCGVLLSTEEPEKPLSLFLKIGFKIVTVLDNNKIILVKFLDTFKSLE